MELSNYSFTLESADHTGAGLRTGRKDKIAFLKQMSRIRSEVTICQKAKSDIVLHVQPLVEQVACESANLPI